MSFADDPREPISLPQAQELLAKTSGFFETNSSGALSLVSTVTPVIQLPASTNVYFHPATNGYWNWEKDKIMADARAAARGAGYDTAQYDLDAVRFNAPLWQSQAVIGGKGIWLVDSRPNTIPHELGHNFGLRHANTWEGELNGNGRNVEYGNRYDMMGTTARLWDGHFSAYEKLQAGWLSKSNVVRVVKSGIYRIYAHDVPTHKPDRIYALSIHKDEREYWVEKRSLFEEIDYLHDGLVIYWSPWLMSNAGTELLDASPDFGEALPLGVRLTDAASGIQIIPVRQPDNFEWTDVAVIVGEPPAQPNSLKVLKEQSTGAFWGWFSAAAPASSIRVQQSSDLNTWSADQLLQTKRQEGFFPFSADSTRAFFRALQQ